MAERFQGVKGMNDLFPPEVAKWGFIERSARALFERFGYREVRTPLVEPTALFVRGVGAATDIVEKQMYTFEDRDGRSLSLRPEGTAPAVRAYIEHSVAVQEPVTRWYYLGPMFRYERMQRGRYRQFYQIGAEVLGVGEPTLDAEVIAMVVALFSELGVPGVAVRLNSVGGPDDRPRYRDALVAYFRQHLSALCEDCKRRLELNPLRIFDCKNESCMRVAAGAPKVTDHLGEASRAHYDGVKAALGALAVGFAEEPGLVRGLDYYTGTVFEVVSSSGELGAQNALCGGGRYDNLVLELGGPAGTPAFGFAIGVERLALAIPRPAESFDPGLDLFIVAHGAAAQRWALAAAHRLRLAGRRVELSHKPSSFKAQMKRADKLRARLALLVGEDELRQKSVKLRDMASGEERLVAEPDLVAELARLL
ncbi:MAG TPA: histidine--tRNA ligase [Polyangia bacterium]|nr:histidine--tRNA ligase [Polyangia bacterium]